jgi:3-hydroxyacyl-CoA dehydrogenase
VVQGVKFGDMDKAMIAAGMPVGPITLADEVGVDVANHLQ